MNHDYFAEEYHSSKSSEDKEHILSIHYLRQLELIEQSPQAILQFDANQLASHLVTLCAFAGLEKQDASIECIRSIDFLKCALICSRHINSYLLINLEQTKELNLSTSWAETAFLLNVILEKIATAPHDNIAMPARRIAYLLSGAAVLLLAALVTNLDVRGQLLDAQFDFLAALAPPIFVVGQSVNDALQCVLYHLRMYVNSW
jgi:hypothetical protein